MKIDLDEQKKLNSWNSKVKFQIPETYRQYLEKKDWVGGFLLANLLIEFYLRQLIGITAHKKDPHILERKSLKKKNLGYLGLGELLQKAKELKLDHQYIQRVDDFKEKRNLIFHRILEISNFERELEEECRKGCELANKIWKMMIDLGYIFIK